MNPRTKSVFRALEVDNNLNPHQSALSPIRQPWQRRIKPHNTPASLSNFDAIVRPPHQVVELRLLLTAEPRNLLEHEPDSPARPKIFSTQAAIEHGYSLAIRHRPRASKTAQGDHRLGVVSTVFSLVSVVCLVPSCVGVVLVVVVLLLDTVRSHPISVRTLEAASRTRVRETVVR